MVKRYSASRFFSINTQTILIQTDTTVGFLSQDEIKLQNIKSRNSAKPFIKTYQNFKTFLEEGNRAPNSKKAFIRRSKKTTFIVNGVSFRVAQSKNNSSVVRKLLWSYSTSANESGKKFNRKFCELKADIIIEDKDGLKEQSSSTLYKINSKKIIKLR